MQGVGIGVIGIGGFGATHIEAALHCVEHGLGELSAVVARLPHNPAFREAEREEELEKRGVRVYRSYEELLEGERGRLDLVTVPLGIALHEPVSVAALNAGYHVLCEKPAAGSSDEARRMIEAQRRSGRYLSIGFQHLLTPGIQGLKRAALDGRFGRLLEARTIVAWPRDSRYYARNEWAGRLSLAGRQLLDSPLQNAAAHFMQNMLYVAGPPDGAARPVAVYAENYQANPIESADTQFLRVRTESGAHLVFAASHALRCAREPYSVFTFERATIAWDTERGAWFLDPPKPAPDGGEDALRLEGQEPHLAGFAVHDLPFVDTIHAITAGGRPKSTIESSLSHLVCVESAFSSSGGVHRIPPELCTTVPWPDKVGAKGNGKPTTLTAVEGLEELLERSFELGQGPAELDIPWGRAGRIVHPDTD